MDYHKDTHGLIERMCRNVERRDFILNKEKAEECILKTYDLFSLKRPSKVKWCVDIFDKEYGENCDKAWSARSAWSVWSAGSAWSARSVGSAWSAWSARSAWSAWSAGSARSAWSAWSVGSAGSAWSAWSARSAGSAGSAGSGLDYDFDWFVIEFEYCKNPDKDKLPNENDKIYLEYSELLMQAKEYGLGYRVEWKDILYLVPTPLVLLDNFTPPRFHSLTEPAIRWKGGNELYFIHGVSFDKDLWKKVVKCELLTIDILKLQNIEQRYIALKLYGATKLLNELDAELIDDSKRGNKLFALKNIIPNRTLKLLKYNCPSTNRCYVKFVPDNFIKADEAQSWLFSLTLTEYGKITKET